MRLSSALFLFFVYLLDTLGKSRSIRLIHRFLFFRCFHLHTPFLKEFLWFDYYSNNCIVLYFFIFILWVWRLSLAFLLSVDWSESPNLLKVSIFQVKPCFQSFLTMLVTSKIFPPQILGCISINQALRKVLILWRPDLRSK